MNHLITTNDALIEACQTLAQSELLFIDTEFLREKTYYSQLCLVQLAGSDGEAIAVDVLAKGLDIEPLLDLIYAPSLLKIFHAGRQDIEIFVNLRGSVPQPIFDTQIAAMVLGLGEQVGYNALVQHFLNIPVSKAQQFTDWSRRPLKEQQLEYALDDVRHLRDCYPFMLDALEKHQRRSWVDEEMQPMLESGLYVTEPDEAWKRIKKRDTRPRYLGRLQMLSAWREHEAIRKDKPRGMILRDDCLQHLALSNPKTIEDIEKARGVPNHRGIVQGIYKALQDAEAMPTEECPHVPRVKAPSKDAELLRDALKLLQKMKAEQHNVTPRLLSSNEELDQLLQGDADAPALHGWRHEMFGADAQRLLSGEVGFKVTNGTLVVG